MGATVLDARLETFRSRLRPTDKVYEGQEGWRGWDWWWVSNAFMSLLCFLLTIKAHYVGGGADLELTLLLCRTKSKGFPASNVFALLSYAGHT